MFEKKIIEEFDNLFMRSPFESRGIHNKLNKLFAELGNRNLNLIPSENVLTKTIRKSMLIEVGNRYHLPTDFPDIEPMPSRKNLHKVLLGITDEVKRLYQCQWCDIRPLSGINLMMTIMGAFKQKAKNFMCLGRRLGGHSVTAEIADSFGYKVTPIPDEDYKIDFKKMKVCLQENKETIVYLDHSICLDFLNYENILQSLKKNDVLFYDISHLNIFWLFNKSPIYDARFIFGGTFHKSFPGPQKAFVGSYVDSENTKLLKNYLRLSVSNPHIYNIFSLSLAIDCIKENGFKYMQQVLRNANQLAEELNEEYEVYKLDKKNYTKSHQIWLRTEDYCKFTEDCARANISVYRSFIPVFQEYGMRLGVQEITYLGLTETHMKDVANAIILANQKNKPTEAKKIIDNLLNIK